MDTATKYFTFALVFASIACIATPREKQISLDDALKTIFLLGPKSTLGSAANNAEILTVVKQIGARREIVETIVSRSEALGLGVEASFYKSHIFLRWHRDNGVMAKQYELQVAIDDDRRPVAVLLTGSDFPMKVPTEKSVLRNEPILPP